MTTDFGRDTWCLDSRRTGRYVSGALLVGQRFYRCLMTPRGSLRGSEEEENWGEDLPSVCGLPGGRDAESKIRAKVQRAARTEQCLASVQTTIASAQDTSGDWTHTVTVVGQTAAGPFELVLAVGAVTVALIGLKAA
jgi:phage baseplate assembly protein W